MHTSSIEPNAASSFQYPYDQDIRQYTRRLFGGKTESSRNRRRDRRQPYPYPIYLTPADPLYPTGPPLVVIGKHLSERGVDFYSTQPIAQRQVIASFPCDNGRWLGFLLNLSCCRFNKHGWYENGGRFLQVVPSPFDEREPG